MTQRFSLRTILVLALALGSCGPSSDEGENGSLLRVVAIGSVKSLNPYQAQSEPERILAGELHEGLVGIDANGQITPALAESWWVSEDGLSYIFRLREMRWPNGRIVSPDDVVRAFRKMVTGKPAHPLAEYLAFIRNGNLVRAGRLPPTALGAKALTNSVIEISLEKPLPAFLGLLANPSAAIIKTSTNSSRQDSQALGPYKFVRSKDTTWSLVATKPQRLDIPPPGYQRLMVSATMDVADAIERFRMGQADIVTGGLMAGLSDARTLPLQNAFHVEATYGVYGLTANTASGPLKDVRLRRALSMTIERDTLVKRLFNISAMPAITSLVPPNLPSYETPEGPAWAAWTIDQRMAEAQRLFTEAGYNPDKPLELEVILPDSNEDRQILSALSENWQPLGVKVIAKLGSAANLQKLIKSRSFALVLQSAVSAIDSPSFFLGAYLCQETNRNTGKYCNREADRLFSQALETANPEARIAALKRVERLMAEESPFIPLFVPVRWSLVQPTVTGWMDNPLGRHPLSRLSPETRP